MAKKDAKEAEPESPDEPGAPKRKLSRMALTGVLCVVLAAGGYTLGSRSGGPAEPVEAEPVITKFTDAEGVVHEVSGFNDALCEYVFDPPKMGKVIDIPSMNVNLAGGHYLRVAVSLGLNEAVKLEEDQEFIVAPARDIVVSTLSGRTLAELQTEVGRDEAKTLLTDRIVAHYGEDVLSVFLTEFVMQ